MRLSVVRPGGTGCRSVWLKGRPTPNDSGSLPSPQQLYATTANILKWQTISSQQF